MADETEQPGDTGPEKPAAAVDNERTIQDGRRLGRLPSRSTRKALMFADFFKYLKLPKATAFWSRRQAIPVRTFGNTQYGDCTIAKQAVAAMRMERLEQKRTIEIDDQEVIDVYLAMTDRLYGGGDVGAFETDALDNWRNPDLTFEDRTGHPFTIDAYLRLNPSNQDELRAAIALAGARGIAVCLNLPLGWADESGDWNAPDGTPFGEWLPGSWGGHSMWCFDYTPAGIMVDMTWDEVPKLITWDACAIYLDEAHVVLDSVDAWRRLAKGSSVGRLKVADVVDAVNGVSSIKIGK